MKRLMELWNVLRNGADALAGKFSARAVWVQYFWIALFLLLVILLNLQFIAKSGDAIHKWGMARVFVETGSFHRAPDHHLLRWGLMWPVIGLIKLLGDSVYVYYIYPIFCYIGGGLAFFALCRQVLSPKAAPAAVLLYALYPEIISEGTQFLPMGPAAGWIFLCLLFSVRAVDSKRREALWMFGAGLMLVIAHGCKETSFYWAPGIFLFLAFAPTSGAKLLRAGKAHLTWGMLLFALTCIAGLLAETLILNRIYGCTLGRFELLRSGHLAGMTLSGTSTSLPNYFVSFLRTLHWHGKYFSSILKNFSLLMGIAGAVFLLWEEKSNRRRLLAVAFLGAFFCHSYIVFKLNPVSYPEKPHHRYFIAMIMVGLLVYACALPALWRTLIAGRSWRVAMFLAVNAVFVVNVIIYDINARINDGNVFQMERMRRAVSAALQDGTAIGVVTDKEDAEPDADGKTLPDKWGILYLRAFGNIQDVQDSAKRRCAISPYDRKRVIVWLTAPRPEAKQLILKEYSIVKAE